LTPVTLAAFVAVWLALWVSGPLVGQSPDSAGPVTNVVRFSVPSSQVENWERAVERVVDSGDSDGNGWRVYQSELKEYLLFAVGPSDWQSRVVDGFAGASSRPTARRFAPLREVRYDVTQHDVWRLVSEWSTRDEIDPAAYASITIHRYRIKPEMRAAVDSLFAAQARLLREMAYLYPVRGFVEDERRQDVMVIVFDPAGPGGFMNEHGAADRWQALMRDVARVITAHTTTRGRFVPELSVARLR
jgi:hypothetical protein